MKVRVHLPENLTELQDKITKFQAKKLVNMCTAKEVEAIIKYIKEGRDDARWKEDK